MIYSNLSRFMANAFGYNVHFAFVQMHRMFLKFNRHGSFDNEKNFIGIFVIMPNKVTLKFSHFELIIVHLSYNLW